MPGDIVAQGAGRKFSDHEREMILCSFGNERPNDLEFDVFIHNCEALGLDPLMRQAYLIKRKDKWTLTVSIDGYRTIAERTGAYLGSEDAEFTGEPKSKEFVAKVVIHKVVQGMVGTFSASARWDEYAVTGNAGQQWNSKPHIMLAKCAEALALRKAFPGELASTYVSEEMEQAGEPKGVNAGHPVPPIDPAEKERADEAQAAFAANNVAEEISDPKWYASLNLTADQRARVKKARGDVAVEVVIAAMRKSGGYDDAEDFTKGVELVYGTGKSDPTNALLPDDAPGAPQTTQTGAYAR